MIYFDNAASTRALPQIAELFSRLLLDVYANPASGSRLAMEGEKILKESANTLASCIHAQSGEEIFFTSGGTESNNWAVFGTAKGYHRSGKHVLTTQVEHPAIRLPFEELAKEGFEVEFLPVDERGKVDVETVKNAVRPDTILVSTIFINNETGTINDIEAIGKAIKEKNPDTIYHVDAVQGFGKAPIHVQRAKIDLLSASGHKFHAPKGLGFLYRKKGLRVKPLMFGGGHQQGQRPGTENVAGAAALALAAKESYANLEAHHAHVLEVKRTLAEGILQMEGTHLNGDTLENASPYVLNIRFDGLRGPVLLNALEDKGIFASAGSACNTKKKTHSAVLGAMGLTEEEITGALRFSFCRMNTIEEAEACVKALEELVPMLRRFNRKR